MDEHVDYREFVVQLRRLVQSGASVSLRMVTDDRHFVNIGLNGGRIVSVYHGARRGARALETITQLSGGVLSLWPAQNLQPQPDLPSTQEIMRRLEKGNLYQARVQQELVTARPARPEDSRTAAPEPSAPSPKAVSLSDQDIKQALSHMEEALLHLIGPIAKILVKDTARELGHIRSRDDLVRLVQVLSGEIDDTDQARRFTEQILASLPSVEEPGPVAVALSEQDLEQALFRMEEALLHLIGPIARMVVKDTARELGHIRSRDDLARLAEILGSEIDDPVQARRFTEQISASLTPTEPATTVPEPSPQAAVPSNHDLEQALSRMEARLLRLIGPAAKIVVEDTVQGLGHIRSRDDLVRLAEILSREIEDPEQARQFTEQVLTLS